MGGKIILIGAGGHCVSIIDVIEQESKHEIFGILDPNKEIGEKILGYQVLGGDDLITEFLTEDFLFCLAVGQIKSSGLKRKLASMLPIDRCPNIVSPLAYISKHAKIGFGNHIMHNVVINADTKIGNFNILNTKSNVEHGVEIGDCNHISTGAMINGDCKLGSDIFIGSNATLSHRVNLSSNQIISAGTFLNREF